MDKYFGESNLGKETESYVLWNMSKIGIGIVLSGITLYYTKKDICKKFKHIMEFWNSQNSKNVENYTFLKIKKNQNFFGNFHQNV